MIEVAKQAKGLIFDLDGTLADTMPVHYTAYQQVLGKYGIDYPFEVFMALAGVPAIQTIEKINEIFGADLDPVAVGNEKEAEYESLMHMIKPIEQVVDVVRRYAGVLPMSIGTGGYRRLAQKTIEMIGVDKYIHIMVTAEDVAHHKPHPETFLRCAELMGVEPRYCLVFEDGQPGMQAAKAAGMMALFIPEHIY